MKQNLEKKWVIVQIKLHSYDLASRNLERQGFEIFLPKMKVAIRKETKFITKEVFVFPGYMFVGVDQKSSNWTKINSTYGVSKLLTFNNKPSVIPLGLIVALRDRYENNINLVIDENLKKGDTIKFNNGPFADLVANIESINSKNRIYALFKVMGGFQKLEITLKEKIDFVKI